MLFFHKIIGIHLHLLFHSYHATKCLKTYRMKYINHLLFAIIIMLSISCNSESTLKVTGITVSIDSQYNRIAEKLLGKNVRVEFYDQSVKLIIDGQPSIFLIKKSNRTGYEYSGVSTDSEISYWMHIEQTLGYISVLKLNSSQFIGDPEVVRKSTGIGYLVINTLTVNITAKP